MIQIQPKADRESECQIENDWACQLDMLHNHLNSKENPLIIFNNLYHKLNNIMLTAFLVASNFYIYTHTQGLTHNFKFGEETVHYKAHNLLQIHEG